ncbi:unnamed protein product [Lepidochelys kempii]
MAPPDLALSAKAANEVAPRGMRASSPLRPELGPTKWTPQAGVNWVRSSTPTEVALERSCCWGRFIGGACERGSLTHPEDDTGGTQGSPLPCNSKHHSVRGGVSPPPLPETSSPSLRASQQGKERLLPAGDTGLGRIWREKRREEGSC